MKIIDHQLIEINIKIPDWQIEHLFIGTFNPFGGHPVNYYYGRESNYFWKIISKIFDDNFDPFTCSRINEFYNKLKHYKIACIDIINSIEFNAEGIDVNYITGRGYSDSKIINNSIKRYYNTKLINDIILNNPSINFYSTWGKGSKLANWIKEIDKLPDGRIELCSPSRVAKVPKGNKKFEYILYNYSQNINP